MRRLLWKQASLAQLFWGPVPLGKLLFSPPRQLSAAAYGEGLGGLGLFKVLKLLKCTNWELLQASLSP